MRSIQDFLLNFSVMVAEIMVASVIVIMITMMMVMIMVMIMMTMTMRMLNMTDPMSIVAA